MGSFIKEFLRGILNFVLVIFYVVLLILVAGLLLAFIHNQLYGAEEYIFYTIPYVSLFSLLGLLGFWSMFIILKLKNNRFKAKLEKEIMASDGEETLSQEEIEKDKLLKFLFDMADCYKRVENKFVFVKSKAFKSTLLGSSLIMSLILLIISFTNYLAIDVDSIIIKTTFNKAQYSYDDIKEINTGITAGNDINLYYRLVLADGRIADIMNGSFLTWDESKSYEQVILDFDKELLSRGINKVRDLENLEGFYKQNYDSTYTKNVIDIIHQ